MNRPWQGAVDNLILTRMRERKIPGLTLAVIRNGTPEYVTGYGKSELEMAVDAAPEHIYQSGSVGKMFTAFAVVDLVDRGKLGLKDPLGKWLKDIPAAWDGVTIEHLLHHRSGVHDYEGPAVDIARNWSAEDLRAEFAKWPLDFEPGSRYSYSNSGYVLLGHLVEAVSGKFYGDYLKERLFDPVGMRTAQVNDIRQIIPGRARGYVRKDDGTLERPAYASWSVSRSADGSLLFNIPDLIAWDRALLDQRVVTPGIRRVMEAVPDYPDGSRPVHAYGCGLRINTLRGRRLVHHGGVWEGFSTWFGRYADGLTIAMLTNLENGEPWDIGMEVAGVIDARVAPYLPIPDRDEARTARDRARVAAYLNGGDTPSAPVQQRRDRTDVGRLEAGDDFQPAFDGANRIYRVGDENTFVEIDRRGRMTFEAF